MRKGFEQFARSLFLRVRSERLISFAVGGWGFAAFFSESAGEVELIGEAEGFRDGEEGFGLAGQQNLGSFDNQRIDIVTDRLV